MKTAISLPSDVFQQVESASAKLGISRSEFFRTAAERWLFDLDQDQTTAAIDQVLDRDSGDENEEFLTHAARSLDAWR